MTRPVQRQRRVVVEQPAVEPRHFLEPDGAAVFHGREQAARHPGKPLGPQARLVQHAPEHLVRQQPHVLGEHAEDQPVDEVRHRLRLVPALPQPLGQFGKGGRRLLGQRLPRLFGPQPLGVAEGPLEQVARGRVVQLVERELVDLADAVGPVGVDAEAPGVRDDQQRWILQRQRVLP